MKESSDKSGTTSKWTAFVAAHVKRQMYAFCSVPLAPRMDKDPVKSTPVTENGGASSTLIFGRGGRFGAAYGRPLTFLQVVHFRISLCTARRMAGIQYLWRRMSNLVKYLLQLWKILSACSIVCVSCTYNLQYRNITKHTQFII